MNEPEKPGPKPQLAVALRYDAPHAPTVTAVGRGEIGRRIIELAKENGVPLEEDPLLAEALSRVEVGAEIPEALYRAVAIVLGFVLSENALRARGGA